jgi:dipeptidyl aminopeptidase/acylaminoacyl peptidase
VWDAQTGQPITQPLQHHGRVASAQFSADGQRVVTASWDKTARVWDARTGQPLTEPLQHKGSVYSAQFSVDGQWVVTASEDNTARVWDARTGQPLTEPLGHNGNVYSAQFSPNGDRVVTASRDRTVRVWHVPSGQLLTEPLKHNEIAWSAQFSPDGQRVVTVSYDLSPDEQGLVTRSHDKTARVWDMPSAPLPAPKWLLELAEAVGGERINERGVAEPVPVGELLRLKRQVADSPATDYYARWAQWFFADRATRAISPNSSIAVPEYVQRRMQENTLESLHEAVSLSPTNGLAYARLARQVFAQIEKDNPRRLGEADFFSRYAVKWAPNDAEAAKMRAEIAEQIKNLPKP